jgi:hypothetical protein
MLKSVLSATLAITCLALIVQSGAFAQGASARFSTLPGKTMNVGLYRDVGSSFQQFGIAEIQGTIEIGPDGVEKGGEEAFLNLQIAGDPDKKKLNIVKKELVKGRIIITTEDNKVYTIYDIQSNLVGKIAPGRVLGDQSPATAKGAKKSDK